MNVCLITFGCSKNLVDSEVMSGILAEGGLTLVDNPEDAEIAIVNTCGFLESSIQECVDYVLELNDLKEAGVLKKIVVTGCIVSRFGEEFSAALPEGDVFLSTEQVPEILKAVQGEVVSSGTDLYLYDDSSPRLLSGGAFSTYVKIAEGCSRKCSFCTIPAIRGPYRSRRPESVLAEVKKLGEAGVQEINLIAQDLTVYGQDLESGGTDLSGLLSQLELQQAVPWVRLLYLYPTGVNQKLLETILESKHICPYLDLPLQHVSESVLRSMYRPVGDFSSRKVVEFIKKTAPELHLRTTFIVGFPGETEENFRELESFVESGVFDGVGVFTYSAEAGTEADALEDILSPEEKEERKERLMLAQQKVLETSLESHVGKQYQVLLEGEHPETELLLTGRTCFQAPDVDGTVLVSDSEIPLEELMGGKFYPVEITGVAGYDLTGRIRALKGD